MDLTHVRVLAVDDDECSHRTIASMLAKAGCEVYAASSPEEALVLCVFTTGIRALVLDVLMPRIAGTEVAQRLHSAFPDLRFLFVSGTPLIWLPEPLIAQIHALPATAYDFLPKPFTSSKLIERLNGLLETLPSRPDRLWQTMSAR